MDLQAELDRRITEFDRECAFFARQQGEMSIDLPLHHYTNDAGLKGILEGGALWLSDITTLNDPSEIKHGMDRAIDVFKTLAQNEIHPAVAEMFIESLEKHVRPFFVCSFSMKKNDLDQWRAYANDGCGYALEFDTGELCSTFSGPWRCGMRLCLPIKYDDQNCREWLENIARAAVRTLAGLKGMDGSAVEKYCEDLRSRLSVESLIVASNYKHKAYTSEEEVRFLFTPPMEQEHLDEKFRSRSHELVKYHEFPWKDLAPRALTKIWIGPAVNEEKGKRYVHNCLQAYHPGHTVEIMPSKIPYRSMRS
jgi:hypothetical protein